MTNSIRKSSLAEQAIITNYLVAKVIPEMDFYSQAIKLIREHKDIIIEERIGFI